MTKDTWTKKHKKNEISNEIKYLDAGDRELLRTRERVNGVNRNLEILIWVHTVHIPGCKGKMCCSVTHLSGVGQEGKGAKGL